MIKSVWICSEKSKQRGGKDTMIDFLNNYECYPDDLSVGEIASILQVKKQTVRAYLRAQKIGSIRIGRCYIIPKTELRKYIEKCTRLLSNDTM